MLELFGLDLGTPFQGGSFLALLAILGTIVKTYVMGAPARRVAETADKKIVIDEHTLIRAEYAEQIEGLREEARKSRAEFKEELDPLKKQIFELSARLAVTENESRRRGDRINNLTFLVQIVMGELQDQVPNSPVLKHAQTLLIQIAQPLDSNPAETLRDLARIDEEDRASRARAGKEGPESPTMSKARSTERAAHDTVKQVERDESHV